MDIKDVAEILTNCSQMKCEGCEFIHFKDCEVHLIEKMGKEVRKIAEGMKSE